MSNKQSPQPYAEVISSNLASYTAQCWQWDTGPAFGSLVAIQEGEHFVWGIVSSIETGSSDPQRHPVPYQKTEAELKAEHPQIFEFLATTFHVAVVGFQENERLTYSLPSRPVKIHSFVRPASLREISRFFISPAFLPALFSTPINGPNIDELLLALMNQIAQHDLLTPELFERYYHTFSLLIGNDYRRLKLLLQRISASHAQQLTRPKLRKSP